MLKIPGLAHLLSPDEWVMAGGGLSIVGGVYKKPNNKNSKKKQT
jgi:hypothetical protein